MNPWPFVIAAYSLAALGVMSVSILSWRSMRRAERQVDASRDRR